MPSIWVNEIFNSLQGEGVWTGMPMTFLRLQGCNLKCPYCDTKEAIRPQASEMFEVVDVVRSASREALSYGGAVCVTGGEPTMQLESMLEVVERLREKVIVVHLETNGTIHLSPAQANLFNWITVSPKPPSFVCNIPMQYVSEVKVVVGAKTDMGSRYPSPLQLQCMLDEFRPDTPVWLQPESNRPEAVEWCKEIVSTLSPGPLRLGVSMQMHKLINIK